MKNATLRLLTVVGSAVALSVVGIAPATASPVASSAAASARMAAFRIPNVVVKVIPNQNVANASQKRVVVPYYSRGAGATVISTRLSVSTLAGKVIVPTATRVSLSPGNYRVTQNIRYSYRQSGRTLYRVVGRTQNLTIGVNRPAPAPTVTIQSLANSMTTSTAATRVIRPVYSVGAGAKPIYARLAVKSGSNVITGGATSIALAPGNYTVTSSVYYSYVQAGRLQTNTAVKTQPLTISYVRPAVTQPAPVPYALENGMIAAFNAERAKTGLPALQTDSVLNGFNNRWINSGFTLQEDPWIISPNINLLKQTQSGFTGTYYDPAAFAAYAMTDASTATNVHNPAVTHVAVAAKVVNGSTKIAITWAGIG